MSTELVTKQEVQAETLEKVLLGGNLSVLSPQERMTYYKAVCESVGLNPLTRPFEYLNLNGKLVLYARREATEQLRKIHGVSIGKLEKTFKDDLYIVEAPASDRSGRTDASTGAVNLKGLAGEALANALMKAETKAKRRVTLSICGLGMLDETEVDSIRGAVRVPVDLAPGELPLDDVPAVDVRADVTHGGMIKAWTPEKVQEAAKILGLDLPEDSRTPDPAPHTPTPSQPGIVPPSAAQAPKKGKDFPFLREMGRQKERLGAAVYYQILGSHGYEHSYEITDRAVKVKVFKELQETTVQPEGV